ncbi:MAG: DMT family transporter, partial [Myxococcota bacterium]
WGSTWLVIREGLVDLPPFTSAGVRFAVASALMLVLAALLRAREGGQNPPRWLWVSNGMLHFAVSYAVVYWCEQFLPSGLVSLLWAVYPMIVAILGHLFLPAERLSGLQWLGFVLGLAGVAVLFRTDLSSFGGDALVVGAVLFISPLVAAGATVLVKLYGRSSSSLILNRNGMILAAILLLAAGLVTESEASVEWTPRAVFSVGYLAAVGTVTSFGLYYWLLRFVPAYRLSLIAYITPPVALFLGWAVGGEPITTFTLAGAGLIVLGIILIVTRRV